MSVPASGLQRQRTWIRAPGSALAVFDLDRTLLPGASVAALVRALVDERIVSRRVAARAAIEHACYRRAGSTDAQVARVRAGALRVVAGLDRSRLHALAEQVAEELVGTITPGARMLVARHLDAGDFCVVLSASPQELVAAVGLRLGVQRAIGTRAEVAEGRYTGALEGPMCYGAGKLTALRKALGRVDLSGAWAYADSSSDLPLLRSCGHPVAVNPDRLLRKVATTAGWPVLRLA